MKLWKTKRGPSCVSGNGNSSKIENDQHTQEKSHQFKMSPTTPLLGNNRAMSPAQSEDSGLAVDRLTTYTTVIIQRENAQSLGVTFADRPDLAYPPVIESINEISAAIDILAPGDRVHQIDGISTIGISNQHVYNLLCNGDGPATLEIEYYMPEHMSQNRLRVISKIAQINVERENEFLGLTLRGGGDLPLFVTNVRLDGPVYKTGLIKPGDRLLRVDNISLLNKTLAEAQHLLKSCAMTGFSSLTIEYDVSVIQNLEHTVGPLLIEIERNRHERMGLVLSNYSNLFENDYMRLDQMKLNRVYISNIVAASVADRCGAFAVGDKIIAINGTTVDTGNYNPTEVSELIDASTHLGYIQIQIMPVHALARYRELQMNSNLYGYNTIDSRAKSRSLVRKTNYQSQIFDPMPIYANSGLYRSELVHTMIDCSEGSGICLGPTASNGRGYIITHVIPDSAADRSGCLQKGDRLQAVNKVYNLDLTTIRQMLGDYPSDEITSQFNTWVELEIEYDIADCTNQKCGVFDVKIMKRSQAGLGITVSGSAHGGYAISHIKPGSSAYRTGALKAGDILIAVDAHPVEHFNIDALLKDSPSECITLTIRRNTLPDFLFDAQQRFMTNTFDSSERSYNSSPKFSIQRSPSPGGNNHDAYEMIEMNSLLPTSWASYPPPPPLKEETPEPRSQKTETIEHNFVVKLEKNSGPLGITLAGSEEKSQPITISAVADGGLAQKSGEIEVGDTLLAINGQNIQNMALSDATKLLHKFTDIVYLHLSRTKKFEVPSGDPIQPLYAKVVKKISKSPSLKDNSSTSSTDSIRSFHVVLYKDKVYDDYGFSVSDGLYEKGVYINRIRSGGPADLSGLLKPFDRIMQVNDTKTVDFDCCLTVPLIATAGDKIELVVQRTLKKQACY